ncbi:MAG TPA: PAS domain S-box protein, partial [Gemmatimonadales bacterium]|nr:PAS domain S-box protein [Gemmatimonadales bacterium]
VLDSEWRIVRLNRAARFYLMRLGLEPDRLTGRVIWNEVPALIGTPLFRAAERAVREQRPIEIEAFFPPLERWFAARFLPGAPGLRCFLRDSTAQRAAEQEARSSTNLMQTVINSTADLIYAKDLAGRYVMGNRAHRELLGRDATGLTDRDLFPPALAAVLESNDQLVLARGETLVFEEAGETFDGEFVVFESSKSVMRDAAGRPTGVLGVSRDITLSRRERRRRELLYQAGARLTGSLDTDATLDAITDLIVPDFADYCVVDLLSATGMVQRARVASAQPLRNRRIIQHLQQVVPGLDWSHHPIALALRTGEPVPVYNVEAATLAQFAPAEARGNPMREAGVTSLIAVPLVAHTQVLGALTVAYTGAERRYAPDDVPLLRALADRIALALANARLFRAVQDELAQRTEAQAELSRWGKIFEHAGWGVAIGDPETGRYVRVNDTYARMHGYQADELASAPIWELTAPAYRDFAQEETRRALRTGRVAYASRHCRRDGSEFPVRVDLSTIADGRGVLLAANLQDDSERQGAEERLREAQKMEALGRLAGGVAHDFNNMLMIIMGFADFLVAAMDEADPRRRDAVEIRKASERAASLTQQLMVFGRRMPMRPTAVNLNEVVTSLGDMLRSVLGESVQLTMDLDPSPGGIRVDRGHLEQGLLNLALNAKDAMPAGGELAITTRALTVRDGTPGDVGVELAPGEYELVEVADSGHGMDESTRARIFEPFFTTRAGSRNSGLGLSVVYGMVTQNNGHVWVTSSPGSGSRFTLCFPRIAAVPSTVARAPREETPAGHESVLVVEDERAVRQLVHRALSQAGYQVTMASDAAEALELLARQKPVRVLVSDLVLPGMSGTELAAEARHHQPGIAVVLMSGHAGPRPDDGVVLTKPFAPAELVRRVREAIDGRTDGQMDSWTATDAGRETRNAR